MSRNLSDHQLSPSKQIAQRIKAARRQGMQQRTIQRQGNEALQLRLDGGFFTISIPNTPTTNSSSFYIHADYDNQIMMANLMYTAYLPEFVGYELSESGSIFYPKDSGDLYHRYITVECFLSFDDRDADSGTLASQAAVLGTAVDPYAVRLTTKVRSNTSWSFPPDGSNLIWVYYQIRATVAEVAT